MANSVHSMSSELKQTKFFLELEDWWTFDDGRIPRLQGSELLHVLGLDSISLQDLRSFIVPFSSDFKLLF
jgi:hypothetical protein